MSAMDIVGLVLMGGGVILSIVSVIGLNRFSNVLMRMHAASKTQMLGLLAILAGAALIAGSWAIAGMLLVVVLIQMASVTVGSTMVGRAAFRRGFVRGAQYAVDDLTPRLADDMDEDLDDDGFVDEAESGIGIEGDNAVPENFIRSDIDADLSTLSNWDEPEADFGDEDLDLDIDIDLEDETEAELQAVAERGSQKR